LRHSHRKADAHPHIETNVTIKNLPVGGKIKDLA